MLDAPAEDTVAGLRGRAILSVGLQVGLRRAEIAALTVGDLHQNRGYDSLRVMRKGGRRDALAINPQTAARLRAYLEASGHGADIDGPLFRPLRRNGKRQEERRSMDPDAIDRVVRKYAGALKLDRGYSAHSMRATFITTALENGAQLEDVQKTAGHRDPSTTKLYDRRGYNPEKAASFFATY
jgi:integrase/recombinase XerD